MSSNVDKQQSATPIRFCALPRSRKKLVGLLLAVAVLVSIAAVVWRAATQPSTLGETFYRGGQRCGLGS